MCCLQAVEKEQVSRYFTADVCLSRSVNQLYNNQKMAKLVFYTTDCLVVYLQDSQILWLHRLLASVHPCLFSRVWQICPLLDLKCTGNRPICFCVQVRQFLVDTSHHWGHIPSKNRRIYKHPFPESCSNPYVLTAGPLSLWRELLVPGITTFWFQLLEVLTRIPWCWGQFFKHSSFVSHHVSAK